MSKKTRIVFMGTPEFAAYHLQKLVENNYNIVGIVTSTDKPAGRGKKIQESAVKKYAKTLNIPILQPKNLKSEEFLNELKSLKPDLQIVVAFRMLPKQVWKLPPLGTFNLHASLLPDYRGAAPINWAIIKGEKITGVTTFFIDDKIDTGEMILQEEEIILSEDNASSLHDKLMKKGADLVIKTINLIEEGKVKTKRQPQVIIEKKAPKLYPENTRINWKNKAEEVYNFIRGLAMYPGAWTELKLQENPPKKWIIYQSHFENKKHNYEPGRMFVEKKELKIATSDGFIYPEIIKLQGKKQMDIRAFLNGIKDKEKLSIV